MRPETAAHGAVAAWHDATAATGIDEVYRLVVDGTDFTLASARRRNAGRRAVARPTSMLSAPAHVLLAARRGETTLADAVAAGAATASGSKRALKNFQRVFRLP